MSYNAHLETREIADSDLDAVAGGAAGLMLASQGSQLSGEGGAELAGHSVIANGAADLPTGQANLVNLTVTAA